MKQAKVISFNFYCLLIEFRDLVRKIKKGTHGESSAIDSGGYLPYDFNSLLAYLSKKTRREKL